MNINIGERDCGPNNTPDSAVYPRTKHLRMLAIAASMLAGCFFSTQAMANHLECRYDGPLSGVGAPVMSFLAKLRDLFMWARGRHIN